MSGDGVPRRVGRLPIAWRAGPLDGPELVLVGQHVTEALIAAHDVGIVHRDIKPANLMVGGFGQIKVGDFGISALARGDDQTKTASLTLAYASPEELGRWHNGLGPPSDVYSLAATLHHLITGIRPTFSSRIQGGLRSTTRSNRRCSPLRRVIMAGLSDAAEDRPTMREFSSAFDNAAASLGPRAIKRLEINHRRRTSRRWSGLASAASGPAGLGKVPGRLPARSPAEPAGTPNRSAARAWGGRSARIGDLAGRGVRHRWRRTIHRRRPPRLERNPPSPATPPPTPSPTAPQTTSRTATTVTALPGRLSSGAPSCRSATGAAVSGTVVGDGVLQLLAFFPESGDMAEVSDRAATRRRPGGR